MAEFHPVLNGNKDLKSWVRYLTVALGAAASIQFVEYFQQFNINGFGLIILASFVGLLTYKITETIVLEIPYRKYPIRRRLDSLAKYEGFWIQKIVKHEKGYLCLLQINYRKGKGFHVITGWAFDKNGNDHAEFSSEHFFFDSDKDILYYIYKSNFPNGYEINGMGRINFSKDEDGYSSGGSGFFIDGAEESVQCNFDLYRLNKEEITELIGPNKSISVKKNKRELVEKYGKKYFRFNK